MRIFDRCMNLLNHSEITLLSLMQTRNVAIGNNPCIPYDACVEAHTGPDPDLVAWEQVSTAAGTDRAMFGELLSY